MPTTARSLLVRLESPGVAGGRDLPGNPEHVIDSVCRHLQVMLNTRQGSALTVPDYGTTDYSDIFRGSQSVSQVQEDIRRSVEKYEPRLRDVQVSFTPREDQPFTMHFEISGSLQLDDGQEVMAFESVVETNGEVRVSRGG